MRKLIIGLLGLLLVAPASAQMIGSPISGGGSSTGSGVSTASDCDQASYYAIGKLCQDTDDAKLYKGTGAAIAEITAGSPGDIASDAIWDAAGDTVYGTGANTAAKLGKGTAYQLYMMNAGATAPAWTSTLGVTGTRLTAGFFTDLTVTNAIAGAVTGNAGTATALAADPANCAAGEVALGVNASGVAECTATPSVTTITGALSGNATTATALAADPAGCTNQFTTDINAAGTATCASVTAAYITNNTITTTQLAAALTFADGDLLDLSAITHTGSADEGLILPNWADVTPTSDKKFLAVDGSNLKLYNGGWVTIGATGAPTDASYLTLGLNGTLSAERVFTEGLAIDFTDGGANSTLTIAFDPTELTGNRTFAAGGAASVVWTWDNSGTTDPTLTFGDGLISTNSSLTVATGKNITLGSTQWNSADEIDGTKIKDADYGDVTVSAAGAWSVEDDSHAHGSTTITLASTNLSDTSNIARLDAANTFTGNNTFGNGDTDTLTIRSLLVGGNSRGIWIAGSAPTPSYATGTNELYVAGDIETAGTVYAASFNGGTGTDGSRELVMITNTGANVPTATGNKLYFIDNVLKVVEDGTAKDVPLPADSVTWTGATHSFAGVTSLVLPTATPDANGEIAVNNTNETLLVYINSGLKTFDFSSDSSGYVLKSNGSGTFTLAADETGGTPALTTVTAPVGDTTFEFNASEEINWQFTGNYSTGSQFLIEQLTGNPSGGVLFEVKAADTDTTLARFGDGTNYLQISTGGNVSHAGTSVFTAPRVATSIAPSSADGATLGTAALEFSDLYLANGGVIYFQNDQSVYLTPSAGTLTLTGAFVTSGAITPSVANGAALGSATAEWADLFLHDGAVIYGQADQSATLTSSASTWTASNFAVSGTLGVTGVATFTANPRIYDGDSHHATLDIPNIGGDITVTFPATTSTLAILGANTFTAAQDFGDNDLTSLDKLEGYDAAVYIDLGADGTIEAAADTLVTITSPDIRLQYDAAAYLKIATADGGATTISAVSDGADVINIGDNSDDQVRIKSVNSTTNETWSGHTLYFAQCAATMAFGSPAYIQSTGKPGLADADAAATMPAIGLVVVASTDADTPCTILTHGVITDTDWNWTPGATLYVSETAGSIENTIGNITDTNDVVQVIGIAIHADSIFVNPSLTTVVLE